MHFRKDAEVVATDDFVGDLICGNEYPRIDPQLLLEEDDAKRVLEAIRTIETLEELARKAGLIVDDPY